MRSFGRTLLVSGLLTYAGCKEAPAHHVEERRAIEDVPVTDTWNLPHLSRRAHVVYTEAHVPHVYAANDRDAARITGFLHARDRFTQLELTRRFGQGILGELVGSAALAVDQQSRGRGANEMTDRLLARLSRDEKALLDAYVEGINTYVAMSKENPLDDHLGIPTELLVVGLVLRADEWSDTIEPFTRRDAVAILTAVLFNSSFTSDDLARQRVLDAIPDAVTGAPNAALREAGARDDLFDWVTPVHDVSSAAGFGLDTARLERELRRRDHDRTRVPAAVLERALASSAQFDLLRRGPPGSDYGSNAWAISGRGTADGHAILSGDGHLPLSVPGLLYQMGVDTTIYGSAEGQSLLGLYFPGVPLMPVGTNGQVAFSFTYLYGDLVDWYAESITLDADGAPASSLFRGEQQPLVGIDETYVLADVPALGSVGRTEVWRRYKTFDGRAIVSIEGDPAPEGTVAGPGQTIVSMAGERILPRDVDGDGTISAISFDYTGFDVSNLFRALRQADRAATVEDFREAQRSFVGFAQNFVAADTSGSVYYSGYTGTPCRSSLGRVGVGDATRFAEGADPRLVLDGTQHGAFEVPLTDDNVVDETHGDDESRCVVPFDRWPQALDPAAGFTLTANNDLGGLSFDGSLANDEYYLGGPWAPGYRAKTIRDRLALGVASANATVESMQALQADHVSHVARELLPYLVAAIDEAKLLTAPATAEETRVRALYDGAAGAIDEAMSRLAVWDGRGSNAASGVETYYDTPTATDRDDAAATMIWNAFFRSFNAKVFDDEGLAELLALDPRFMRITSLRRFLAGRGAGNTAALASFDPATNESVFFDDRTTGVVESSREILVASLVDALTQLTAAPSGPAQGGFGTTDQSTWLWGMRHQVALESLITAYAGDIMGISPLTLAVRITTKQLPLAPNLPMSDPRAALLWHPRPGDWFAVDAANPPLSGPDYVYRNGPVMRMVVELGPNGFVRGENIIPAGESGIAASPFFADQAALWLGNRTLPMRYAVDDVVAHAIGHDVFE